MTRDPIAAALPHPTPSLLNLYPAAPCICKTDAQHMSLFYVCIGAQYCELLFNYSETSSLEAPLFKDTSFQGTQIFAQKNVEIICVYVTSNPSI